MSMFQYRDYHSRAICLLISTECFSKKKSLVLYRVSHWEAFLKIHQIVPVTRKSATVHTSPQGVHVQRKKSETLL